MVPFYGQGMNAGMEDVRILFSVLDKHSQLQETNNPHDEPRKSTSSSCVRSEALAEYSAVRAPDAYAINELALQNYVEMRSSVLSRRYRLRKYLEEFMSVNFPSFGWHTKYSRVSFSNERYSDIIKKSDHQGKILVRTFMACAMSPLAVTCMVLGYKHCRGLFSAVKNVIGVA